MVYNGYRGDGVRKGPDLSELDGNGGADDVEALDELWENEGDVQIYRLLKVRLARHAISRWDAA